MATVVTVFMMCICADFCRADVIQADSVAEFSGTQGENGWYYGYYDGDSSVPYTQDDFELLTQFPSDPFPEVIRDETWWTLDVGPGGYWTSIAAEKMHPNSETVSSFSRLSADHWVVRRYVSEFAGPAMISGRLSDSSHIRGDGIIGTINVGGVEIFREEVLDRGLDYSVFTELEIGTPIDFVVDPRANGGSDTTIFTAIVTQVPEPGTNALALLAVFSVAFTCRVKRRR